MLKKTLNIVSGLLMFLLPISIVSCGGEENDDYEKVEVEDVDTTQVEDEFESMDIDYVLPSPLQVAQILKNANLKYNSSLLNKLENADAYSLKMKKTLNFGIYSADLAFSVLNNKTQDARDYMKVVKQLADEIGLQSVFDGSDLMDRFEASIGDEGKTMDVLIEIQEKTDLYLAENQKQYVGVITFSGAWIEGMYFGANDALKNRNEDVGYALAEQITILGNLIKGLESEEIESEDILLVVDYFKKIRDAYNNFESVKTYDETKGELQLTDSEIKIIADMIMELRSKVVAV